MITWVENYYCHPYLRYIAKTSRIVYLIFNKNFDGSYYKTALLNALTVFVHFSI